ncbi:MAG TPA: hypothetical protein VMR62_25625 [Bryobacteraceae bacterium]|jgi:hypothetical protein|nr:hypothetical protein [Bryobacteraceae bacterium]
MAKKRIKVDRASVRAILQELDSLVEEFDPEDPEDIQFRIDDLITAFAHAGILKTKEKLRRVRLHNAIRGLKLELPGREELIVIAESIEDLINSYGEDPPPEDLAEAQTLLNELAEVLRAVLNQLPEETP